MELDDSNFHNKNTEQLINGMMSFLEDSTEIFKNNEDFDETKNPLCTGIKEIIGMFPAPPPLPPPRHPSTSFQARQEDHQKPFSRNTRIKGNSYEKACRHKDPYMNEVNRLMFCSTMGHPPHGSPEYFEAAENYALYGKEFLDFPIDIKFPRPMEVGCFDGDVSMQLPSVFPKSNPSQGFGTQSSKYPTTSVPQLPVMLNPASYWATYPCYQTQNLVQPLMYSNPFLMTQYLNMFVRETQINTSIVQQHQFLAGTGTGGIQERLVYAQMLQQQIQTNQIAQTQGSFLPNYSGHVGKQKVKFQDLNKKSDLSQTSCEGSDLMKMNLNGSNLYENNLELD